jgi:hypothetical protein
MIGVFVGFSCIFLLGILIFKGLNTRRLCKSFGVKGLMLVLLHLRGTPWRSWFSYCATSWKVASTILDGVTGIIHYSPGLTQPLPEMSKGKAIPLQPLTGPEGASRLRLPVFKTLGT